jgi:hypothetical protein
MLKVWPLKINVFKESNHLQSSQSAILQRTAYSRPITAWECQNRLTKSADLQRTQTGRPPVIQYVLVHRHNAQMSTAVYLTKHSTFMAVYSNVLGCGCSVGDVVAQLRMWWLSRGCGRSVGDVVAQLAKATGLQCSSSGFDPGFLYSTVS